MAELRFIDLFAGIGGFHHAIASLGGRCELAVEIDEQCRKVYAASFPDTRLVADVRSLTRVDPDPDARELAPERIDERVPDHDLLCAGFPCQPFSKSGHQEGVRDKTRGTLFFDIMSIILAKRPRYVMLENVRNLAGPRHRDTWETIVDSLRDAGYRVSDEPVVMSPHLLAPWEGGAPQVRDRVFILATRVDGGSWEDRFEEPLAVREPTPGWDPDRWRIADILLDEGEIPNLDDYLLRPEELSWIEAWQAFVQEIPADHLPGFPIWADSFTPEPDIPAGCPDWKRYFLVKNSAFYVEHRELIDDWRQRRWGSLQQTLDEFPPSRRKFEWQARKWQPRAKDRDLRGLVMHMRPSGIRVKPPTYLPALVAITQTSIIGPAVPRDGGRDFRRISPREAATLQGIPASRFDAGIVSDSDAYRQLGNAVNAGVVRALASALTGIGNMEQTLAV